MATKKTERTPRPAAEPEVAHRRNEVVTTWKGESGDRRLDVSLPQAILRSKIVEDIAQTKEWIEASTLMASMARVLLADLEILLKKIDRKESANAKQGE